MALFRAKLMGEDTMNIKDVKVGMIFDTGTATKDGEKNIARVTKRPYFKKQGDQPNLFYAIFVNSKNYREKRMASDREFAMWDFMFEKEKWRRIK